MSHVRGQNTAPEKVVRHLLHAAGYRFRLHRKDLPGKPDIVLPRFSTAIFVHGCFWHGHAGCKRAKLPTTRIVFWREKISGNKARDKRRLVELAALGYKVSVVWQCELTNQAAVLKAIKSVLNRRGS